MTPLMMVFFDFLLSLLMPQATHEHLMQYHAAATRFCSFRDVVKGAASIESDTYHFDFDLFLSDSKERQNLFQVLTCLLDTGPKFLWLLQKKRGRLSKPFSKNLMSDSCLLPVFHLAQLAAILKPEYVDELKPAEYASVVLPQEVIDDVVLILYFHYANAVWLFLRYVTRQYFQSMLASRQCVPASRLPSEQKRFLN